MKALILANVGHEYFCKDNILPSCYLPLHDKMNVLERQISLLHVNGFTKDDICVLFGTEGIWETESVKKITETIKVKKIFTEKNDLLCKDIFSNEFFAHEDILIIEGNQVFDIAILSRLIRYQHDNVLVVKRTIAPEQADHFLRLDGDRVQEVLDSNFVFFPWVTFAGVARFSQTSVEKLRKIVVSSMSLLDAIKELIKQAELISIDYEDLLYGRLNGGHSDELTGGSYASLNFID